MHFDLGFRNYRFHPWPRYAADDLPLAVAMMRSGPPPVTLRLESGRENAWRKKISMSDPQKRTLLGFRLELSVGQLVGSENSEPEKVVE